ncbi:MAG: hypothetical protein ACMUIP_17505 [bacterium]
MISFICMVILCIPVRKSEAQLWQALPPYNVLWPLWSPVLSPPDPASGLPSPLLTSLTKDTVLPVEPALVWDPSLPFFYLLYNDISYGEPTLKYFDATWGIFNYYDPFFTWPSEYLTTIYDITSGFLTVPNPIVLLDGYQTLFTFDPLQWINFWVPLVNTEYQYYYGLNPNILSASALIPPNYIFNGLLSPLIL